MVIGFTTHGGELAGRTEDAFNFYDRDHDVVAEGSRVLTIALPKIEKCRR